MSKILYEVYQNQITDDENAMKGKWYARVKSIETMNTTKMAKHISEHGSVFTEDVVEGVMKKFKTCMVEQLLNSRKVKIDGLGTFYLTAECIKGGADKEEDFNVSKHLKALHIRFLPDQVAESNLSSREFIKKAEFVNVKSLLKQEETEGTTSPVDDGSSTTDPDNSTTDPDNTQTGGNTGGNTGGGDDTTPGAGD